MRQFDLFSTRLIGLSEATSADAPVAPFVAADLDNQALTAAIPDATLATAAALADEAARRRLTAALPALEQLCRRFAGFGVDHPVAEQIGRSMRWRGSADGMRPRWWLG